MDAGDRATHDYMDVEGRATQDAKAEDAKADEGTPTTLTTLEINMSTNLEILEAEVLQLPLLERSHLLERLIASLDSDPEVENAWEQEADRREVELESGSIQAISGQDAIARLRERLVR